MQTNGNIPLNTDLSPVAYLYNLKLWDKYSNSNLGGFINFMEEKGIKFWMGLLAGLVALYLIYLAGFKPGKRHARQVCSLFSVFSTGLVAMGASVILIFSYQNFYGYLFEKIGLIIALFMMGLFIGGWTTLHLIKKKINISRHLLIVLSALSLLMLFLPDFLKLFEVLIFAFQFLFYILVILTGFLAGQVFPLSAVSISTGSDRIDKFAARVNAADHLGGCIGALMMGTFFVPILGLAHSATLLAAFEATALTLWLIYLIKFGKTGIKQAK